MIEGDDLEIDVDELKAQIREQVAQQPRFDLRHASPPSEKLEARALSFDWSKMAASLKIAAQYADPGSKQLQMEQFPKPIRWVAKLAGRIVLYLTRVITISQTEYNHHILHALRHGLDGLREMTQAVTGLTLRITELNDKISGLENRIITYHQEIKNLQANQVQQEHRLGLLLDEARQRLPHPFTPDQLEVFKHEAFHLRDPLYVSFEDQFRGSPEDIKERLRVYLPRIREAAAGNAESPILDLGCGRGEWLELLKTEGLVARGLDINRVLVEQCRQRGLDAVEGDVIEYLRSLPNAGLGAVTGFHLAEHLSFDLLIRLLDETLRVLTPGGLAIFETPNPQNILVGACNFYVDPTHQRPLHPEMMRFLVENRGFDQVDILPLHPVGQEHHVSEDNSSIARKFNEFFFGPQDYAVIGIKV
ncbi:MAG: methyltransferase domain-containing protein [Desulfobacterales bacterium]|nr:MAG: methyltransferase domain-containing protein [Desulfobacterales bacterium]